MSKQKEENWLDPMDDKEIDEMEFAYVPEEKEIDYEFSPEFYRKMEALMKSKGWWDEPDE